MTTPLISIIIPVFNSEKCLKRCVDSILSQTFVDFELILVDDGSSDLTFKICEEYRLSDTRIRVFHKENGGVSIARNFGLNQAKGKWIGFIDSDDWIEKECFNHCFDYKDLDELELIMFSCFWSDDSILPDVLCKSMHDYKSILPLFIDKITFVTPWCKFFKKQILDQYNIMFDTSLSSAEDTLFSFEYLKHVKRMRLMSNKFYHYDISQNISSLSKKKNLNWNTEEYLLKKVFSVVNELEKIFDVDLTKFRCLFGESRLNKYLASCSDLSYINVRNRLKKIICNDELSYLFEDKVYMPKGERRLFCDYLIKNNLYSLLAIYFKYIRTEY